MIIVKLNNKIFILFCSEGRFLKQVVVKMYYNFRTIISMEPKDPLLIVNCAKTIMTLPIMVRNFKLGKEYLKKALEMAPNDKAVFEAVEKTISLYQAIVSQIFIIFNIVYNLYLFKYFCLIRVMQQLKRN